MRNLRLQSYSCSHIAEHEPQLALRKAMFAINTMDKLVYALTDNIEIVEWNTGKRKAEWVVPLTVELAHPEPADAVGFSYIIELEALVIGFDQGQLLVFHLESQETDEIGLIEGGIAAMEWSPDGEALAIVSLTGRLLLMNLDWEVLMESYLEGFQQPGAALQVPATEPGASAHSTLTWRGDGKYFAVSYPSADTSSEASRASQRISIWDRHAGELHAVVEATDRMVPAMSWQPNGRHLYVGQHAEGDEVAEACSHVLLFESNGLGHGSFPLQGGGSIAQLDWSLDSELLAVVSVLPGEASSQAVQVWHRDNWHWYLKYERFYPLPTSQGIRVTWDDSQASCLHVMGGTAGALESFTFMWDTCASPWGTCMVVDGSSLLITPLRNTLVPPPMAAVRVTLPAVPLDTTIQVVGGCEVVACITSKEEVVLLRSVEDDLWEETLEEQQEQGVEGGGHKGLGPCLVPWVGSLPPRPLGTVFRSAVWCGEGQLLLVGRLADGSEQDILMELNIKEEGGGGYNLQVAEVSCVRPGWGVLRVAAAGYNLGAWIEDEVGKVWQYSSGGALVALPATCHFPELCPWVVALPEALLQQSRTRLAPLLGLTPSGKLFWGPSLLSSECSSLALQRLGPGGGALLYTTRKSQLFTVLFRQLLHGYQQDQGGVTNAGGPKGRKGQGEFMNAVHAAMRPNALADSHRDVGVRMVEQGSRLVAVPENDIRVVLQLPRGNLEVVCPRMLVLCDIVLALKELRFRHAWEVATRNRVDLNLLVDYRWPHFVDNVEEFVQQIADPDDLTELLFSLKSDSVMAEGALYSTLPGEAAQSTTGIGDGKIAAVCGAIRATVEKLDALQYLNVHVASYARLVPPDLPSALGCIRDAKEACIQQSTANGSLNGGMPKASSSSRDVADAALQRLLLHVDVDELYRVALSMYDLALAYMVVVNAQKDPAEYLVELQRYATISNEHMRQYELDMVLGRYNRALKNLVAASKDNFDRALVLARKHGLMRDLLDLYEGDGGRRAQVLEVYGEVLEEQQKLEDAAVAFVSAGKYDRALQAYRGAHQWRMVFVMAARMGMSQDQISQLAVAVVDDLQSVGQLGPAAEVTLSYLQDVDQAVLLFCEGKQWREAMRVAHQHGRQDLVDTIVAPSGAAAAYSLVQEAQENQSRLEKYLQRWREVRRKRLAMSEMLAAAEEEQELGRPQEGREDAASDIAASSIQDMSVYTDATHTAATLMSSSRPPSTVGGRRAERKHKKAGKKGRIRQGSAGEEGALVEHLRGLGPPDFSLEHGGALAELLIVLGHFEDAKKLQTQLASWLSLHHQVGVEVEKAAAEDKVSQQEQTVGAHVEKSGVQVPLQGGIAGWKWEVLRAG